MRRATAVLPVLPVLLVLVALVACAGPAPAATVEPPPANGVFDIQLGGAYTPAAGVDIVDRDRTEKPVPGRYNLCYVNAFQTQPNEKSFWAKHSGLLLRTAAGRPVEDPGWPGEYLLDTSSRAKRTAIARIVGTWIDGCAAKGFQAVDPDNLDTWTRSGGRLTMGQNLALARLLAQRAHARGLAIGQKNAAEIGSRGRTQVGFDFAVTESCQVYAECDAYTDVYGAHVLEIEYTDTPRRFFTRACALRGSTASVVLRDHDLLPAGTRGHVNELCP